ncbi:MAG: hypothetical protein NC820_06220 [Candidatus Omnitrophica bacterium]|nr:hypothetical protein [Candidatus Omnitrophota bacterium]
MYHKSKFRPKITMVTLNPEQAVLQCNCYFGYINNAVENISMEPADTTCCYFKMEGTVNNCRKQSGPSASS